jgi:HK97 family phage portal protein
MGILEWLGLGNKAATMIDPNFTGSMQFYTPNQPIWSPKNYGGFVSQGYRKNPTVYTCINKISGAAAGITWKLYADKSMKREIEEHPMLDLWNSPNPNMSGAGTFMEQIFGFLHMSGNAYIWAYRPNPKAPPLALWVLRPDRMKVVAGTNSIDGYVYGYGTKNVQTFETEDVLHWKFPAYDDDIYGLSPIEVASYYVDQINEAMGWNTSLMQNMGRPASVFMTKGYLTTEQRNQIKEEIRRKYSGKRNAGMPLVLEGDMQWQNMSLNPLELDWMKSRELNTRDIAAIFDIAPELIGDSSGKTFANVSEAREALYLENVLPKLDRFRDYINAWYVPMWEDLGGAYYTYDKDDIEALQEIYQKQKDAQEARARNNWSGGITTLNEARDEVGLKALDGGDCLRIGAVLVSIDSLQQYADQSLQAPAAPPPALAEPLNVPALPAPQPQAEQPPPTKIYEMALELLFTKFLEYAQEKKYLDKQGVYQPDDLDKQLASLQAKGIVAVKWSGGACDICLQNNGVTRVLGQPFPSGHILPPAHPHCDCSLVEIKSHDYGLTTSRALLVRNAAGLLHPAIASSGQEQADRRLAPIESSTSPEAGRSAYKRFLERYS